MLVHVSLSYRRLRNGPFFGGGKVYKLHSIHRYVPLHQILFMNVDQSQITVSI